MKGKLSILTAEIFNLILLYGSCRIRIFLIGVEYQNCSRTWDVYLLFTILMGQICKYQAKPVI